MIVFGGNEYYYDWESDSEILSVYNAERCRIGTTKVVDFDSETETVREMVVLAFIEAIVKLREAEELLEGMF